MGCHGPHASVTTLIIITIMAKAAIDRHICRHVEVLSEKGWIDLSFHTLELLRECVYSVYSVHSMYSV